ncbi:Integrator complex subunit 7 [Geranomyces variabilis]|nr:Integrator complex subunit 7 [Geranomyces variabilis]
MIADDRGAGPPGFNELVALDRGFKAVRLEEKLQSVLKYIPFFSKYKSPDIVTAGFLKLADYWNTSNNVVRQYIFKVIKHSQSALSTITSAEEVARRISKLLTSNDAVARALTLRVLGFMSVIVIDNIEVHHGVRLLLDSKEPMELGAALFAADRIAFRSKTFAVNHMEKLRAIMEDPEIDSMAKNNVIKVYRHMYHTPKLVTKARQECLDYLASTYSDMSILNILHTMSILACRCVLQIAPQIQLLIKYLETDAREVVQYGTLKELAFLARTQAHHFQTIDCVRVITFALKSPCDEVRLKAFAVIVQLGIGPRAVVPLVDHLNSLGMLDVLRDVIGRGDRISFAAASVLCMLCGASQHAPENVDSMDVDDPDALLMHRLIEVSSMISFARNPAHFRYLIGTIMRVSLLTPTTNFWAAVFENAAADKQGLNVALNIALKQTNQPVNIPFIRTEYLLLVAIKYAALVSPLLIKRTIMVALRSSHSNLIADTLIRDHVSTLLTALRSRNVPAWHLYEIGVEALCRGWPDIGRALFHEIEKQVETEATRFWLAGLQNVAEAYNGLQSAATSPSGTLPASIASNLWRAATAMEAVSATSAPRSFGVGMLTLHARIVSATSLILAKLSVHTRLSIPISASGGGQWLQFVDDLNSLSRECETLGQTLSNGEGDVIDALQMFCVCVAELARNLGGHAVGASGGGMSASAAHIAMYAPKDPEAGSVLLDLVRQKADVRATTVDVLQSSIVRALADTALLPRSFFTHPGTTLTSGSRP